MDCTDYESPNISSNKCRDARSPRSPAIAEIEKMLLKEKEVNLLDSASVRQLLPLDNWWLRDAADLHPSAAIAFPNAYCSLSDRFCLA